MASFDGSYPLLYYDCIFCTYVCYNGICSFKPKQANIGLRMYVPTYISLEYSTFVVTDRVNALLLKVLKRHIRTYVRKYYVCT